MLKVMLVCKLAFYSSYNINKLPLFLCLAVRSIGKFLLWNHDEYELMWCGQNLTVYIEIVSRMLKKKNCLQLTICPTNITELLQLPFLRKVLTLRFSMML